MAKIFLHFFHSTGASGYIGGDLLHLLAKVHPEYTVRALVRDAGKGEAISRAFRQVQIVKGGLEDAEIIAREAKEADIVVHLAASGHLKSVQAIHHALSNKPKSQKSPYWIQISGGSALAAAELADPSRVCGAGSDIIWDDLDGIDAIRSLIKQHPKRAVDNYLLSVANNTPHVKTALVLPPIIYGQGRGPVNQRSIQIPELAKLTLQRQRGVQVGPGQSRWGNVHILDLSQLFLRLVEKAVEGTEDPNIWGSNGLYLTGIGEISFGEISRRIAAAASELNVLQERSIDQLSGQEADDLLPHGSVLYGTNVRGQARRAKKWFGWAPTHEDLEHDIPRTVAREARQLGLIQDETPTARI
ncbi:hypothetical protein B0T10DRAFT_466576 [Thelonectria olida]|uniref:NmrA-like domain-containing protein n=1 Tax=Thelonectria olida TaxID=1576542 RepID=A0A9P8VRL8_9HYPO|nr:hypothetical protein B0T10DRAFT_466576 [Thelonectria olida]